MTITCTDKKKLYLVHVHVLVTCVQQIVVVSF